MQYEIKIEDFSNDLEVEIKSSDFDLITDIQAAIQEIIDYYNDEVFGEEEEESEEESEEEESEEEEEYEEDVVGNQGTTIIINS